MVNSEKKDIFPLRDTLQQRFLSFLNLYNFAKINFSSKLFLPMNQGPRRISLMRKKIEMKNLVVLSL